MSQLPNRVRFAMVSIALVMVSLTPPARAQDGENHRLDVRVVTDQADAVLDILEKRLRGEAIAPEDWLRLQSSQGYTRMKKRAESFGVTDLDDRFKSFVMSERALERRDSLRAAVRSWQSINPTAAARLALAYLPASTQIRAKIYPVIKQSTNSYVFELDTDPAIFMNVDPALSASTRENTLAHELHHVGSASCPEPADIASLPDETRTVVSWLDAFGEGLAVLAAAGGPDKHPHASSAGEAWVVWERDVANFNRDLRRIETFFQAILDGELDEESRRRGLFELINTEAVPQGAFYTVGWKMAAIVERALGRDTIIESVCDPRILLSAYNSVGRRHQTSDTESLALWSDAFLGAVKAN